MGKSAVQMAVGARVVGGKRQVPGESCEGEKDERQESPPALLPQPSTPPPLPSLPQSAQSCRARLGSIAPGVSTACGWTDLRGNTESSGVRRGTLVPVDGGAARDCPVSVQALHTPREGQEPGSWNQPSPPNTRSLSKLTADGAAESSLLFIRFSSPGNREAEGLGMRKERNPFSGE